VGAKNDVGHDPGSIAFLESEGFEGFRSVRQLSADACVEVPNERGIYAVVRDSIEPPHFMPKSPAARFRDTDPTIPIEELEQLWVPGAQILYFGRARGPGVRTRLQQRVKRYLRFGNGRHVSHWDGRAIWQLTDHAALRVAWKPTPKDDPARAEESYQDEFERHYGALPFANLKQGREDE
jgi:hypothetical protein